VLLDSTNNNNQTTRLRALSLINECYKYQMDLTTNGDIIADAIKYVNGKMEHLNKQEKKILQDIKEDKGDEVTTEEEKEGLEKQQPTTNGVF
jgi:hemerythrin-like domain-containing protein